MEINHWAKLVATKLVKDQIENEDSDLIILGHYGGFATYKQDGWSGYAMRMTDFITEVGGINQLIGANGILVAGTGRTRTISLDGTVGGGTNFDVQPIGNILVSKNTDPLAGNPINITNLDTLKIDVVSVPSGLNWTGEWDNTTVYSQDDVVWFEDINGTYYTYWAYQGPISAGTALPAAGQASANGWARLGLEGPTGETGLSTAIMKMYQWASVLPVAYPSNQSVYEWANGTFTPPADAGLWTTYIPSSPTQGYTLWEITQQYTANPIGTTVAITWTTTAPDAKAIAYFGETGTNGSSVLSGSGAPDNSLGEDGDFYIDTASAEYTMYGPKAAGNWLTNPSKDLKGGNGQDGSITYSGAGTPPNGTGVTGDYYIQTDSANYTMFGPKLVDNDWAGSGSINLKGIQGDPGAPGGAVVTIGTTISSTTYTITAANASSLYKISTVSNNVVIQVPDNLSAMTNGSQIMFVWDVRDAGLVNTASFAATGATNIKSANSMKNLRTQYSAATLIKITNTEYYLVGDIAPY